MPQPDIGDAHVDGLLGDKKMPYSTVGDLPPAVKKLPEKRQRQWMAVWNSAYQSCLEKGGADCEASAFAQAWGVVHKSLEAEDGLIFATGYVNGDEFIEKLEKADAALNDLPDSIFAYIEPGGEKDESGKTVPRSLRHFPMHDEAHVRNNLTRLSQSEFGEKAKVKVLTAAYRLGIKLDPEKYKKSDGKLDNIVKILPTNAPQGLFYGIVYEPDVVDSHGDFTSSEEIEKAAHAFLPEAVLNLHHSQDLEDVQVVESYIAPCDFSIEGQLVRKGSWVLVTKVLNQELKDAILKGEITGYSLEGSAVRMEEII
jgi:cation transport regulator ChaB